MAKQKKFELSNQNAEQAPRATSSLVWLSEFYFPLFLFAIFFNQPACVASECVPLPQWHGSSLSI